jgi:hypothetical protein
MSSTHGRIIAIKKPLAFTRFDEAVPVLEINKEDSPIGDDDEVDFPRMTQVEDQIKISKRKPVVRQGLLRNSTPLSSR